MLQESLVEAKRLDCLSGQLFELHLDVVEVCLLHLGRWVDILAQSPQLLNFFDLLLHDVEHAIQVFEVWCNLRLLLL